MYSEARKALRRRRQLYNHAVALKEVIAEEMRAEVARDSVDGAAAVPPLPPAGWAVHHTPGSGFFLMSTTLKPPSGDPSKEGEDRDENEPRYRSIHDENLQHLLQRAQHVRSPASSSSSFPTRFLREGGSRVEVVRSQTHLTLFAPFRVQDLSYYDPAVSICEWAAFDVLVRKTPPSHTSTLPSRDEIDRQTEHSMHSIPEETSDNPSRMRENWGGERGSPRDRVLLRGQQRVWEQRECMYLRLASVNSELRIRSVQFLSARLARAMEEFAVFGHGDPFFGGLLRSFNALQPRHAGFQGRKGKRREGGEGVVAGVGEYDAPMDRWRQRKRETAAGGEKGTSLNLPFSSPPSFLPSLSLLTYPREKLLMECWNYTGEVARTLAYGGPYLTDLSKELHDAFLTYLMSDLRINHTLAEYVCQMQFFLEQEEYMGWLARWQVMADTLQRAPRDHP
ncbi:unnamed protein product [Phytomonas sp. EM1]|nr:unnamed protein product [Phytomonas sp. EM1]|eukprot:CCW61833.1 unnamed protein product [Phytomonas sp. isolate EM1]